MLIMWCLPQQTDSDAQDALRSHAMRHFWNTMRHCGNTIPCGTVQISTEMMLAGEMLAITDITNKMVARGDISDAYYICRAMADHGHQVTSVPTRHDSLATSKVIIARAHPPSPAIEQFMHITRKVMSSDWIHACTNAAPEKRHPQTILSAGRVVSRHRRFRTGSWYLQEFLQMIANENLPEPVKVVKEHVDGAIAWVTGSGDKGANR